VTIEYDPTSGESTQEVYDPNTTAVLTSQVSQETVGDLEPAGIPGTPSNVPNSQGNTAATQQAKSSNTTQGIRSESKTFAVSHTTHRLLEPAGRIKRIAAAILVDDASESKVDGGKTQDVRRKRTPEEMKQLEELAKAAIGFDEKRGDLFSLQNIAFEQHAPEVPQAPGKLQRVLTFAERWTGVLRYAALLLLFAVVYLLVLQPVKNQVVALLLKAPAPTLLPAAATSGGMAQVDGVGATFPTPAEPSSDLQAAVSLKNRLVEKVKSDPETASKLIQTWLKQGEDR
jgi:flagellar M-ring protein FliF